MFHLAFPVINLADTINFYVNVLDAKIGRKSTNWVDFNLKWNQITVHQDPNFKKLTPVFGNGGVPINHFGVILILSDWKKLRDELIAKKINFLVEPKVVFEGEPGEQYTFFVEDPNGYAIEFKGFVEFGNVFRTEK
ncbi:MAG: VOC family protein [Vicingaceae bacterium]